MDAPARPLVAYYRVSTRQQGDSGLGLEGQVAAVEQPRRLGRGRRSSAPPGGRERQAGRPPRAGQRHRPRPPSGATLVIAKLDRLARNVHFLSGLMEAGVDFVACDNPHANRLTIHILAAVAEDEARRISERTRAALAAYKARGGVLGAARPECPEALAGGWPRRAAAAAGANRTAATAAYADLARRCAGLRAEGRSLRAIAARLNAEGHATRQGRPWGPVQVRRALARA